MEDLRLCKEGGYLIGGGYRRMGTPHQYMFDRLMNVVGCSRLRCDDCGAVVVNVLGRELAEGVQPRDAYWEPGGAPSSELVVPTRWANKRLYCCRCTERQEMSYTSTQPSPPYDYMDPLPLNWRCAGHPALPRHLDGTDQLAVAEQLLGSPSEQGKKYLAAEELQLMLRAADAELHATLLALLQETLVKDEGLRLARALATVDAEPAAFIRQLAAIDPDQSRFQAEDATRGGWTLRERLSHTVGECIMNAPTEAWAWCALQDLAKKLLIGTRSRSLIEAFCRYDAFLIADMLVTMNGAKRS